MLLPLGIKWNETLYNGSITRITWPELWLGSFVSLHKCLTYNWLFSWSTVNGTFHPYCHVVRTYHICTTFNKQIIKILRKKSWYIQYAFSYFLYICTWNGILNLWNTCIGWRYTSISWSNITAIDHAPSYHFIVIFRIEYFMYNK